VYSYVYFGKYAALERMRLNSYYAARYTRPQMQAHCNDLLRANLLGPLDAHAAYVITDPVRTIWALDGVNSHVCQAANGFNVCTPAIGGQTSESGGRAADTWTTPEPPGYTLNETLDFRHANGSAVRYETFGWDPATPIGTWTDGPLAMIRLGLDPAVDRTHALTLEIHASPFLAPLHPQLDVDVFVNAIRVATWTYRIEGWPTEQRAEIPPAALQSRPGLDIEFRFRNPEAPLYVGAGQAPAYLGLAVQSVSVHAAHELTGNVNPAVVK
jgi:hypothetical protein